MKRLVLQAIFVSVFAFICVCVLSTAAHAMTFVVDSTADGGNTGGPGVCDDGTGDCTLRAASEAANTTPGADVINFAIPGAGVHTIGGASAPYDFDEEVVVDASTQPGASCGTLVPGLPSASNTPHVIMIELDNSTGFGLMRFNTGADNSIMRGFNMHGGPDPSWIHVWLSGANDVTVECNYLGTDPTGASIPAGTQGTGILFNETLSTGNIAQNNLISGYSSAGVFGRGSFTVNDNLIGTDATGTSALASNDGVVGYYDAVSITLNSNVISGNTRDGVNNFDVILDTLNENYIITDNYIGRDLTGAALGNGRYGVNLKFVTTLSMTGNTIADNLGDGALILAHTGIVSTNTISNINSGITYGTYLPTDTVTFSTNIVGPNGGEGATVNATGAIITGNTFTTNSNSGLSANGDGHTITLNTATGNNLTGMSYSGNGGTVSDNDSSSNNDTGIVVGGTSNLVHDNTSDNNALHGFGISGDTYQLYNNTSTNNDSIGINVGSGTGGSIYGNFVGLDSGGVLATNNGDGVFVTQTTSVTIGGDTPAERNYIAGNGGAGVHIYSCGTVVTEGVTITGNYIGTNLLGLQQTGYGNSLSGVEINEEDLLGCGGGGGGGGSVYKNVIGGDAAGEPNTIVGNGEDGIRIYQAPNMDVFSNSILPNVIYGNSNLGINLAADTTNDGTADAELGPNALNAFLMSLPAANANYYLNHPTINSTEFSGSQITAGYSFVANQADNTTLMQANVIGYRLDFYLGDNAQDGAYAGYNQPKTHLGYFIVDGSETNATHVFTSPVTPTTSMSLSATATVLWTTPGPP